MVIKPRSRRLSRPSTGNYRVKKDRGAPRAFALLVKGREAQGRDFPHPVAQTIRRQGGR
jgi:hypothetical protein